MFDKIDKTLIPPALFGGLIAIGLIGAGAFIGSGVVNAQVGNRQVTVRGVAERHILDATALRSAEARWLDERRERLARDFAAADKQGQGRDAADIQTCAQRR